ncbi:MAG: hypothetical protein JWP65_3602 [Ramlibacter sp.]|jgi:hypothetical protein|uniref:hypothetical protein n=1 Tax=Ramlibacter sp. TaxID=1917967 RepID=UPI00261E19E2|nr:hypothetical protein [Ramlibacter sp.]MDB5753181.1 hypothetical protein [Ramlibacter sp.]
MPLTPWQRAVLVRCDGQRSEKDLLLATASTRVTRGRPCNLRELGLAAGAPCLPWRRAPSPVAALPGDLRGGIGLTPGLGPKRVRLSMAVEAVADFADFAGLVALAPHPGGRRGGKAAALEAVIAPR